MTEGKKYGLILPSKVSRNKAIINTASVFGNDEDDDEDALSAMNRNLKKEARNALIKKQVQLQVEKALEADPTVYEYDNIYDDLQAKKGESDARIASNVERKPKYIGNLLKAAEQRKREMERRLERTVQKEREAEKGLYDDKEAFVTDAYRRKMEELRAEEERERKKEEMEANMDVTKQADITGFYRNFLNQTTGGQVTSQGSETTVVKTEPDATSARSLSSVVPAVNSHVNRSGSDSETSSTGTHRNRPPVRMDATSPSLATASSAATASGDSKTSSRSRGSTSMSNERGQHRQRGDDQPAKLHHHRQQEHCNEDSDDGKRRHQEGSTCKSSRQQDNDGSRRHEEDKTRNKRRRHHSSSHDETSDNRERCTDRKHKRKSPAPAGDDHESTRNEKGEERRSTKDKFSLKRETYERESRSVGGKTRTVEQSGETKPRSGVDLGMDKVVTSSESSVKAAATAQPDVSKLTVGGSLESARERFLARKAAIKVPIVHEESD